VWCTYQGKHPTLLEAIIANLALRKYSFSVAVLKGIYQRSADTSAAQD
jgi:hypothetical protein